MKKAQEGADQPWQEKAAGAQMAVDVARSQFREFVAENRDGIFAEFVARTVTAWRPYREAVDRANALAPACAEVLDDWGLVAGAAGIPLGDSPAADAYVERPSPELPMPRSLVSLARELLEQDGGGE